MSFENVVSQPVARSLIHLPNKMSVSQGIKYLITKLKEHYSTFIVITFRKNYLNTSDVIELPGVDKCFSALDMPFEDDSVDAFFMFDVLHHINDSAGFFAELNRCLKNGGKAVMIEPANTLWGMTRRSSGWMTPK